MKSQLEELIGECAVCGESVYCKGGFLEGTNENGLLLCPKCSTEPSEE